MPAGLCRDVTCQEGAAAGVKLLHDAMEELLKQLTNPVQYKLLWFSQVNSQAASGIVPVASRCWPYKSAACGLGPWQEAVKGRRTMDRWYALLERVLEDVRARGLPGLADVSLMAHLLRIVDPATGAPLTDAQLLPELGIVFVAGMETSGKTMGWTLCAPCEPLKY